MQKNSKRSIKLWIITIISIIYGILTIRSSVMVLFIDGQFRQNAGNYLPMIVWFNFFAGIASIITGIGFWMKKLWSTWMAFSIVVASIILFSLLGVFILQGAPFETRTIIAMTVRTAIWVALAFFARKPIIKLRYTKAAH